MSMESILKEVAIFAVGALAGGFSEKYLAGMLKSRLFILLFGILAMVAGAYMGGTIGKILLGFGAPYVATFVL